MPQALATLRLANAPRVVATPRALSALAVARKDVAPLAFICSMTGMTLAAKRSAFALLDAMPRR
jgi:hypothetical protein